jgi:hypothetical protein
MSKKTKAADAAEVEAAADAVDAEFEDVPQADEPTPDDPAIFGGAVFGGSVEMTILPPGMPPERGAPTEFQLPEHVIDDHLAPVRAEARACYQVYHDTLQGLPVLEYDYLSPAQQASWLAVAQRSLASKEA